MVLLTVPTDSDTVVIEVARKMKVTLFFLIVFLNLLYAILAAKSNVICYHGSWSTYRWGNGKFTVEDIDPNLCTHIAYGFVGLNDNGTIKILDPYLEIDLGNLKRFTGLKKKNPSLKALLSIGGWNEGSPKYSLMASSSDKRAVFINSALTVLETYGFDGLDIDWEYPAQRGGAPQDKVNYITLLKECKEAFNKRGLLLTAAVAAAATSVDISYDVPALSKYLDLINVMAYDLHGVWDGVTGENAPLRGSTINVDDAMRGWIKRGADPKKLILGLAAYGRSFTLRNKAENGIGAATSGAGNAGKYTSESGMLGFNEIVELQSIGGWTIVWNGEQKTPYMYKDNQWVGYDNAESIREKVKYAVSLNLGGVMVWSIETEDFRGISGEKFPLLNAIRKTLQEEESKDQTNQPATQTEESTTLLTKGPEENHEESDPTSDPDSSEDESQEKTTKSEYEPSPTPYTGEVVIDNSTTLLTEKPESNADDSEEGSREKNNSKSEDENQEKNTKPSTKSEYEPSPTPFTGEVVTDNDPTPDAPNEPDSPNDYCKELGYVRDPRDCSVFFYCLRVGSSWLALRQQCAAGLMFDKKSGVCNYSELVEC